MLNFTVIPITPLRQNSTLIWDSKTKEAVLTDVGGEIEHLLKIVDNNYLNLKSIWLTHGHFDHVGGVVALTSQRKVPVLGPNCEDKFLLEHLPETAASYHFPRTESFEPDTWLNDGDSVSVGEFEFKVLHIPGHTPGSVVYYCEQAKLLIAGDVLFRESIGRSDFPRGDGDALLQGIREKLFVLPRDTRVITGHGALTTIGHELEHNPFF